MIFGAPCSLEIKRNWLNMLAAYEPEIFQNGLRLFEMANESSDEQQRTIRLALQNSFTYCAEAISDALRALQLDGHSMLYLTECWYDPDLTDDNEKGTAPFLSLEKALEYVRFDMEQCEYSWQDTIWYKLEKWEPTPWGGDSVSG